MEYSQFIKYFISLIVVCNPFSAIPAFVTFTRGRSWDEKKKTVLVTSFAILMIFMIVTWIGAPLLEFFGIRIAAFQVAGGFVLFLLALSMLNAEPSRIKETTEDQKEAKQRDAFAVVPLAMPIIAGPGAISTVIVATSNFSGNVQLLWMTLCALCVTIALGACLYFATRLEKWLGQTGMNILGRIGGLVLAAIAVETMSKGFCGIFPGLSH